MDRIPTLHDEFSYTGYWWHPDHDDDKWAGTLSFKPEEGARLELIDVKGQIWPDFEKKFPRLLGIVLVGKEEIAARNIFTLLECESLGGRVQNGISSSVFLVRFVLRGLWYSLTEKIVFESVNFEFSSLSGWMPPVATITSEFQRDDTDHSLTRLGATYQKTPSVEIHISAIDADVMFTTWLQSKTSSQEIHWRQSHFIRIVPETAQSLDWYLDQIYRVRDLLSILAGLPVEPKSVHAVVNPIYVDGSDKDHTVHIYHSVRLPKADETYDFRMPFPLYRLGNCAQDVFEKWFELGEDQLVPFNLCLDVINNAHPFWQFEFLALVQALESCHRLFYQVDDHQNESNKTPLAVDKNTRRNLIGRLRDLRELFPPNLSRGSDIEEDFLNSIVRARNYYTHYAPKHRQHAFKSIELYKAITQMIPFVAYFLYRELGIPDKTIFEGFEATRYRGLWKPRMQENEQARDAP